MFAFEYDMKYSVSYSYTLRVFVDARSIICRHRVLTYFLCKLNTIHYNNNKYFYLRPPPQCRPWTTFDGHFLLCNGTGVVSKESCRGTVRVSLFLVDLVSLQINGEIQPMSPELKLIQSLKLQNTLR